MLPSIAKHAASHQIHPLKKHGQNFIFDSSLCDKIVRASGLQENANVLEIGPGTAGLTRSILKMNPSRLTVIETDERCIPLLNEIKEYYPNLNIIKHDALKITLSDLMKSSYTKINLEKRNRAVSREAERTIVSEYSRSYKDEIANLGGSSSIYIISNLPYHIGTELVIRWLKESHLVTSITVMLQKEVVERICAKPSTKSYGRLSVICQLIAKVEKCFDVAPTAFYPPPKIYSAVVKLTPLNNIPAAGLISKIELITNLAFAGRRKMIKSSLKNLSPNIGELLAELNINDNYRAENLTPNDYLALAELIYSKLT